MNKSQILSVDLILAFILFVFVLLGSYQLYVFSDSRYQNQIETESLLIQTQVALRNFFHTQGVPQNWYSFANLSDNVHFIGLESHSGYLYSQKIQHLQNLTNGSYIAQKIGLPITYSVYGDIYQYNHTSEELKLHSVFGEKKDIFLDQHTLYGVDENKELYQFKMVITSE